MNLTHLDVLGELLKLGREVLHEEADKRDIPRGRNGVETAHNLIEAGVVGIRVIVEFDPLTQEQKAKLYRKYKAEQFATLQAAVPPHSECTYAREGVERRQDVSKAEHAMFMKNEEYMQEEITMQEGSMGDLPGNPADYGDK